MSSCYSPYRLLDLFCGEGLSAWGYWSSGRFSEIVGIDNNNDMKSRYAFDFLCQDVLSLNYEFLDQFDFIHASPPCQAYSYLTPDPSLHPRLILNVKHMLFASGKPHVVENVPGSALELRPNFVVNGHYFGLVTDRPRYFYVSSLIEPVRLIKPGNTLAIHGRDFVRRDALIDAMGLRDVVSRTRLDAMTRSGIEQGVPPQMTRAIADLVVTKKVLCG